MLAIPNSLGRGPTQRSTSVPKAHSLNTVGMCWLLTVCLLNVAFSKTCFAETNSVAAVAQETTADFARRAQIIYENAKAQYQSSPNNLEAAWQFGRASYDWADYAKSKRQRAEIAQEGIAATQKVVDRQPELALGHYYL